MNEERSMQLFLSKKISEDNILIGINSVLNFQIETIDTKVDNALGFLQLTEYSSGFKVGCLISWPESVKPNINVKKLSEALTEKFKCEILCETINNEWFLVKPGPEAIKVEVLELGDGITVST
jgi:hypothetical protein